MKRKSINLYVLYNEHRLHYKLIVLAISCMLMLSCQEKKPFHVVKQDNPVYFPDTIFKSYEDLSSPKFNALKIKYQLDTIFHGETDELKRILLLRNWIKSVIKIDDIGPYPGDGSAESILDEALKGHGFHCGHYMVVQNAVMNAYGYVTRCLGAGPGIAGGPDGHHGINEIWLNSYHKWFLSDAKYDIHFEKNARLPDGQGIPLSALEIRDEYLKNKAALISIVKGPGKIPQTSEDLKKSKEATSQTYSWIEWNRDNNKYTNWPIDSSMMIMYDDEFSRTHQWIWDGKPHWAYNTAYMQLVADRKAIEWTPNTITSAVIIKENKAGIKLNSNTPNLKTYQMKETPGGNWKDVSDSLEVLLNKAKNEMVFRTVNTEGVTGAEHKIIIEQ